MTEWRELVPNKSRVRLVADAAEMTRLCGSVGNSWGPEVHHMHGKVFTVVENLPPNKYVVYDRISDEKGLQRGRIYVPWNALSLVRQACSQRLMEFISS